MRALAPGTGAPERPVPRFDARWYLKQIFENRNLPMKPGCGWLPHDWLFGDAVKRSMRQLSSDGPELDGYGLPHGHMALRMVVAESLAEHHLAVDADQVLLTQGSSQALDLVARRMVKPGDVVLVDDPGYPNLLFMLRFAGCPGGGCAAYRHRLRPAGAGGPAGRSTSPRCSSRSRALQSPTCSVASVAHLHRLLQLAEQHHFMLVENDIYADMDSTGVRPSLASLDQLNRVIYLGSFSKTISPNLRTGFLAARRDLLDELVQLKMISGLTSSEITERITFGVVTDGRWRKHLKSLRERLAEAHRTVGRRLAEPGVRAVSRARGGHVPVGAPS